MYLYRGGRTEADVRAAKAEIASTAAQLRATEQTILQETAKSYAAVNLNRTRTELAGKRLETLQKLQDHAQHLLTKHRATITSLAEIRSEYAATEALRAGLRSQLQSAEAKYERLVGVTPKTNLEQDPKLPPCQPVDLFRQQCLLVIPINAATGFSTEPTRLNVIHQ